MPTSRPLRSLAMVCIIIAAATALAQDNLDTSPAGEAMEPQAFGIPSRPSGADEARPPLYIWGGADIYLGELRWKPGSLSDALRAGFAYDDEFFGLQAALSAMNDGAYDTHSVYELGHYFTVDSAIVQASWKGLSLSGGKGPSRDSVDSPYSVFLSSRDLPAVHLDLAYDSPLFSYQSRWIRLNANSDLEYNAAPTVGLLDRGMNFKSYALKLGSLRLGFEDSIVYLERVFDAEYFLSPAPMFFVEMINTSGGRPGKETGNTNSLMGFFVDYTGSGWSAYGQFLVDDINASFLAPVLGWAIPALNNINNLNKYAWSLGGSWQSPAGTFSFHHGGSTAYCFEATYTSQQYPTGLLPGGLAVVPAYSILPYEYTYYPLAEFPKAGGMSPIPYVDNYIGYKYGENNLAFQVGYANAAFPFSPWAFDYSASLEYVVSGTKSPANPWAEHDSWWGITDAAYQLLDESVLEHSLVLSSRAEKSWMGLRFGLDAQLGYIWNPLGLVEAVPGEAKLWKPSAGEGRWIFGMSLSASYTLGIEDRRPEGGRP